MAKASRKRRRANSAEMRRVRQSGPAGSPMRSPSEDARSDAIGTREWMLVAIWATALLVAIALPYCDGYRDAEPGWKFSGFVGAYHNDYYGYLAWMRQAHDGYLFFKDYYTTEPHGRVFFHPLFWLMGTAARVSGAPLMLVWYAVQALACAALVVVLYRFCAHFTDDVMTRALALLLVTTAAGWGWLTSPPDTTPWIERATDLWLPEANAFRGMATSFFTLPLALVFMLLTFLHALRYVRTDRIREAVWSGLYALALAATHQYDMVTVYAVLGVYALIAARHRLRGIAVIAALSLPFCVYSLAVVRLDPVFALHARAELPSPTLAAYALGWGLPLALAMLAVAAPPVWRSGRDVDFLVTWLAVGLIVLALPVGFERKLMWGVHVPMCVLAAMGVVSALRTLGAALRPWAATLAVLGGSLLVAAVAAAGTVHLYASLFQRAAPPVIHDYAPEEYYDALRWLDERAAPEDVVLASFSIAPMIPGRTRCVVFAGHWAQTVDLDAKAEFVSALFGPPEDIDVSNARQILVRNRVRYIVLDRVEREDQAIPTDRRTFAFSSFAEAVYENAFVTIWKVAERPSVPWDGGDWHAPATPSSKIDYQMMASG